MSRGRAVREMGCASAASDAQTYHSFNGLERKVVTQTPHWAAVFARGQFTFQTGKESSLGP